MFTDRFNLNFTFFPVRTAPSQIVLLGPVAPAALPEERVSDFVRHHRITPAERPRVEAYFTGGGQMSPERLASITTLLYQLEWGETVMPEALLRSRFQLEDTQERQVVGIPSKNNANSHRCALQTSNRSLQQAILTGDRQQAASLVDEICQNITETHQKAWVPLCQSYLQTVAVVLDKGIAQNRISQEEADALSDTYNARLERTREPREILAVYRQTVDGLIGNLSAHPKNCSPLINQCLSYISENLHQDISVVSIGKAINYNPQYLSKLFKREMGQPLVQYIQTQKINAAKEMLTYTNHSIAEISSYLNYSSQSYFTSVFQKHVHMPPHKYKALCQA